MANTPSTLARVTPELTPQERNFLMEFVKTGDLRKAARKLGKTVTVAECEALLGKEYLHKSLHAVMLYNLRARLAPLAIARAWQALETGKVDRDLTRLIALVLDLAHIKVEPDVKAGKELADMSRDELLRFVVGVKKEMDARTIDITPGTPKPQSAIPDFLA